MTCAICGYNGPGYYQPDTHACPGNKNWSPPMTDATKLADDDHARGCEGRDYTCSCGYDDRAAAALRERDTLAAEVETAKRDAEAGWKFRNDAVDESKHLAAQLAAYKAMAEKMAGALATVVQVADSAFMGPDGEKSRNRAIKGAFRKSRATLSRYQAMKDQADG